MLSLSLAALSRLSFLVAGLLAVAAVPIPTLESARSPYLIPGLSLANFTGWNPLKFQTLHLALRGNVDMVLASNASGPQQRVRFAAYCVDNNDHMADYKNEIVSVAALHFSKYPAKILYILENQNLAAHMRQYFASINDSQAQFDKIEESHELLDHVHIIFSEYFPHTLDDLLVVFPYPRLAVLSATRQLLEMVQDLRLIGMHHYMFRNVSFRFTYEQGQWQSIQLKLMDFEKAEFEPARRCWTQIATGPELNVCTKPIEGYTTYMFNVGETILDLLHLYDKEFQLVFSLMPPNGPQQRSRAIKYMLMHGFNLSFRSLMPKDYDNRDMETHDAFFLQMVTYYCARHYYLDYAHGYNRPFPMVNISRLEPAWGRPFVDLMKRLVAFHPSNRITLDEALVHPLFYQLDCSSCLANMPLLDDVCKPRDS